MTYPSSKSLDHHGLVAGFCQDIQLAQHIDDALADTHERKVSFGQLFVAMLLNGLGFTCHSAPKISIKSNEKQPFE